LHTSRSNSEPSRFLVDMNPTLHAQPDADFFHVGSRSNKVEGEPKSPNLTVNPDSQLKFDESQIDSQVRSFSSCAMVGMWMGILCSVKILLL
jgi:hypothetical protein